MNSHGILRIELFPGSYRWEFLPTKPNTNSFKVLRDIKTDACNRALLFSRDLRQPLRRTAMAANKLLQKLATIYRGDEIQYPELRAVTLAQWMLESGRATSKLAKLHYNFGGIKWRREMAPYATRIQYEASDGVDYYCKF